MSGSSFPKIERNTIYGNSTSGVIFRDNSKAIIEQNKIFSNYYQLSTRHLGKKEMEELMENNTITGQSEFSKNCVIF